MNKHLLMIPILAVLLLAFALPAGAESMGSEHYRISSSVFSAGGTLSLDSADYRLKGTLGQPTPLMQPFDPPFSDNYTLSPGFWYMVQLIKKIKFLPFLPLLLE